MFDALYISATGMNAQQRQVDTIANNIVNANTNGYKKTKVSFTDLMTSSATRGGAGADEIGALAAGVYTGAGIAITGYAKQFDAGDIKKTDSAYDIAISGDGFLEMAMPDGTRAYTRGGTLRVNRDGMLATPSGVALRPGISIPDNLQALVIQPDGRVQAQTNGQATLSDLGQLELFRFTNPGALSAQGDNTYRTTAASGDAILARADEDGVGRIVQGSVEGSNVRMVDEMVGLMVAQRAYEANVKIIQASDEMLGMINGLRK
jgi:flagellar basal-body rod protein FlgG